MTKLRFFYFGRFEAWHDDALLPSPATLKSQSLLAYLVRHREKPFSRDHLMTLFWSDRPSRRARRSLSTAMWHVRRCLPDPEVIAADRQSVQFQGKVWLDVEAFEKRATGGLTDLETAAALYRGDFLDGFYDDWVIEERLQLHGRFLGALNRLATLYENANRHQQALATALRLLEQDPLQETAHRAAMRTYARLGQRNAALEQYRRCQEVVRQELDVEPMPETTDLAHQIRDGRFPAEHADITPITITPDAATPARMTRQYLTDPVPYPFVGRAEELAWLRQRWQSGQGGLMFIGGEGGVGKTRLVQEFARQLRDAPTLHGRCYEFERLLPFQPFAEALRPLATSIPAGEWAQLPAWVVTEIARLLPELWELFPSRQATELEPDRTRLFNALGRLLGTLVMEQPLLFILEDLHWATESTLQLLHYLTRHLAGRPALLIGTYRSEMVGPGHPLTAVQRKLSRAKLAHARLLPRLSAQEVEQLIVQLTGDGEPFIALAKHLYRETEGNAFFLREVMQTLPNTALAAGEVDEGALSLPASVSAAILARVERLPAAFQEALRLATVLGREFDFELLRAVWEKDEEKVLTALESCLRHRLVAEGTGKAGRDYAFTHHKIQEVLYAAIPVGRRHHYHARVAASMETVYKPEEAAGELAFHYHQACQSDKTLVGKAVSYLQMAGEQASEQFAHEEATDYFSQALELMPENDPDRYLLLLAREKALDNQGEREAQARDLADLKRLVQADEPAPIEHQATVALRQASFAVVTANYDAAIEAAQTAVAVGPKPDLQAEALLQWALALYHQGQYDAAASQLGRALPQARTAGQPRIETRCLTVLGLVHWRQSRYEQAKRRLKEALAICRRPEVNDSAGTGNALGNLGIICRYQGELAAAREYFEQSLTIWRENGHRRGEALYLSNLGVVAMDKADYAAARDYYGKSLLICREIGDRDTEQHTLNNLGAVCNFQGDFAGAADFAQQALATCREIGNRHGEGITYMTLGEAARGLGDGAAAQAYYEQALAIRREHGDRRGEALALWGLGELARQEVDADRADKLLQEALVISRKVGDAEGEIQALISLAKLTLAGGEETAVSSLEQALRLSRELKHKWLETRALTVLAQASLQHGKVQDAHAQAEQALALAREIGARALEGDAWQASGLILETLNRIDDAADAYGQAITVRRAIQQEHRLAEPSAGLDRISDPPV